MIFVYVRRYKYIHIYMYVYTYMPVFLYVCKYLYTSIYADVQMHIYISYIYVYTYTVVQERGSVGAVVFVLAGAAIGFETTVAYCTVLVHCLHIWLKCELLRMAVLVCQIW